MLETFHSNFLVSRVPQTKRRQKSGTEKKKNVFICHERQVNEGKAYIGILKEKM